MIGCRTVIAFERRECSVPREYHAVRVSAQTCAVARD